MISLHISFRENLLFGRQEEISTDHFHILRWFKAYFRDTKPFFQDKFNMQTYPFTSNITSELQKHFWVQSSETQTKFHIYFFSKRAGKKEIATHEKFALKYSYYKLKQTNKKKTRLILEVHFTFPKPTCLSLLLPHFLQPLNNWVLQSGKCKANDKCTINKHWNEHKQVNAADLHTDILTTDKVVI